MKKNRSTLILNIYLLTTAALLVGGCFWLSINDAFLAALIPTKTLAKDEIGYASLAEGQVRRRARGDLLWMPLRNSDRIYDSDMIFTGPQSRAVLKIKEDTTLMVAQDSLLRIQRESKLNSVSLHQGSIEVSSARMEPLKVHINDKSSIINLMGVVKKIHYEDSNRNQLFHEAAAPFSQSFGDAANVDNAPTTSSTPSTSVEELTASTSVPITKDLKSTFDQISPETKRNFILPLFLAYLGFSVLVVREVIQNRKTSV